MDAYLTRTEVTYRLNSEAAMQRNGHANNTRLILSALVSVPLLACAIAANAQIRFFRAYVQVRTLTIQSRHQEMLGNKTLALENLKAAQKLVLDNPDQFSALETTRLSDIVDTLENPSRTETSRPLRPSIDWILKSLDPLSEPKRFNANSVSIMSPAVNMLERAFRVVPKVVVVTSDVRRFSSNFRMGARDYRTAFNLEKQQLPFLGSATYGLTEFGLNNSLIDRWMATPRDKRIFVTGARSDTAYAQLISERYANGGFELFFYQNCKPLCDESTVGAFFGSSGQVIHIESPAAEQSVFVPVEVGLVAELNGTGRRILVIDSREFDQMETVGKLVISATLLVCTTDAVQNKDSLCLQFLQ